MFIQTQKTPNPNSLKFLPGIKISNVDSVEFLKKDQIVLKYKTVPKEIIIILLLKSKFSSNGFNRIFHASFRNKCTTI